jgi:hypothetical protein
MIKRGVRGLSTIVATLLIILLTMVAVGIVWVVVRNVIVQSSEQVSLGKLTLNLEISKVQIINYTDLNVTLKRNTGEGEFIGIDFIVSDGTNREVIKKNTSLKELEVGVVQLSLTKVNASQIKAISIAPIFQLESGKEITGDVKYEYEPPTCIPSCLNKQCGNDGCGGNCGTCVSGQACNSVGLCFLIIPAWQTGMVSWWKFDGNANDTNCKNNGTVYGAILTNVGCKAGYCYVFDGVNDYIDAGNSASLDLPNVGTLVVWAKIAKYTVYPSIVGKGASAGFDNSGYGIELFPTNSVNGYICNRSNPAIYDQVIFGSPALNTWHNYILKWNGTFVYSYLDGVETQRVSQRLNVSSSASNFLIGTLSSYFNGTIDEVMVFNRSLNSTEIQQVYSLY